MEYGPIYNCWAPDWDPLYYSLQVVCAIYSWAWLLQLKSMQLQMSRGQRLELRWSPVARLGFAALLASAIFIGNVFEDLVLADSYSSLNFFEWSVSLVLTLAAIWSHRAWKRDEPVFISSPIGRQPLRLGVV